MTWMRFGFMTAVKVTDNGLEYQFWSRSERDDADAPFGGEVEAGCGYCALPTGML
jgi:hypothetical protein